MEIDEAGVTRLQKVLEENRKLAEDLAAAFDGAASAVRSLVEELGLLPDFSGGGNVTEGLSDTGGLILGLDTAQAQADLEAFIALAKKPVPLSANAAGITAAARSAYSSVKSIFSSPVIIKAKVEAEGGKDGVPVPLPMSTGGRFSGPANVRVAEDGDAEYIIPVEKEDRAVPLLRQLLEELSPAAREQLDDNVSGFHGSGLLPGGEELSPAGAGQVLSAGPAAGEVSMTSITRNNANVSAPVSIQVHAAGADAERIGQKLYDTAERYLLRTLNSAIG